MSKTMEQLANQIFLNAQQNLYHEVKPTPDHSAWKICIPTTPLL
jgi:hypothetical protein